MRTFGELLVASGRRLKRSPNGTNWKRPMISGLILSVVHSYVFRCCQISPNWWVYPSRLTIKFECSVLGKAPSRLERSKNDWKLFGVGEIWKAISIVFCILIYWKFSVIQLDYFAVVILGFPCMWIMGLFQLGRKVIRLSPDRYLELSAELEPQALL